MDPVLLDYFKQLAQNFKILYHYPGCLEMMAIEGTTCQCGLDPFRENFNKYLSNIELLAKPEEIK